jgi:hypothetical protein
MMDIDNMRASYIPCSDALDVMTRQSEQYMVSDYFTTSINELRQSLQADYDDQLLADIRREAATCRRKMNQWINRIVSYCHFKEETGEMVVNCLDRFVSSSASTRRLLFGSYRTNADRDEARHEYQLAAVACLYMIAKVHEPQCLSPATLSQLSNGMYTSHDVERMEVRILEVLQWRVHLPTTSACIRQILSQINALDDITSQKCHTVAQHQITHVIQLDDENDDGLLFCSTSTMSMARAAVFSALLHLGVDIHLPLSMDKVERSICESLLHHFPCDSNKGITPSPSVQLSQQSHETTIGSSFSVQSNKTENVIRCFRQSPRSTITAHPQRHVQC